MARTQSKAPRRAAPSKRRAATPGPTHLTVFPATPTYPGAESSSARGPAKASARSAAKRSAASFVRERPAKDTAGLDQAQLLELYEYLLLTRRTEEHLVALYRQNQVIGGVYRSLGQEATAVGCTYALAPRDLVSPLIRDLGAMITHGVLPIALLRQYMAKATGPSAGRDLNAHFSSPQHGLLGPVSMLGAMIPVMTGCLLAARMQGEHDRAGLAFIGDGGSSTGAYYEGLNFAVVRKLPLISVIESNHYAYSTPTEMNVADGDLVRRARGFGCTVVHLDGNDVLACYEATRDARARAIEGVGPTVLVVETYRRKGHAEHDAQKYVPEAEPKDWADHNDPVTRYERFLVQGKHATQSQLDAVRTTVDAQLDAAREQAVAEPLPDPATQEPGVWAHESSPLPPVETWMSQGPRHRPLARNAAKRGAR